MAVRAAEGSEALAVVHTAEGSAALAVVRTAEGPEALAARAEKLKVTSDRLRASPVLYAERAAVAFERASSADQFAVALPARVDLASIRAAASLESATALA